MENLAGLICWKKKKKKLEHVVEDWLTQERKNKNSATCPWAVKGITLNFRSPETFK